MRACCDEWDKDDWLLYQLDTVGHYRLLFRRYHGWVDAVVPEFDPMTEHVNGCRVCECGHCHAAIGFEVKSQGRYYLKMDTLIVQAVTGICNKCGAPYYFRSTDKQLDDLVKRVVES